MSFHHTTLQHIIWDWNGTLLNDAHITWQAILVVADRLGLRKLSFDEFRENTQHPVINLWKYMGFDESRHALDEIRDGFISLYETGCEAGVDLHDGAIPVLESIRQAGIGCSLLSAHVQEHVEYRLDQFMLRPSFRHIVGSRQSDGRGKKEEAKDLMKELCVNPEHVLFVGDTSHDAEVAMLFGAQCALVSRGVESERKLHRTGFPVFRDLAELEKCLFA